MKLAQHKTTEKIMSNDQNYYLPMETLEVLRNGIIKAHHIMENSADTSGLAERLFESYITPIVNIYQPIISPLASHNSDNIYRARKCIGHEPFENIKSLYNPPKPSGRASSAENLSILYGSSSMQTCLAEIGAKIGDRVCIAHFRYSGIKNGDFWFVGHLGSFYKSQEQSRYLYDEKIIHKNFYTDQDVINSLVFKDNLINENFFDIIF